MSDDFVVVTLTSDLSTGQLQELLVWLWKHGQRPTGPAIRAWRTEQKLPYIFA